jgi:hypothetical protein|nr:MAG TPA: hypothetical protein [Crassvirales sp.]
MDKQENEIVQSGSSRTLTTRHNEPNAGLRVLNLLDEKQLAQAEVFLKKYMASDKGGIKSVSDGLAILTRAQDMQLPFSTCVEHIHVINGKTGVDIHIVKALLSRAGVVWECTKDYAPQYQYTDGNTIYIETQLPDYCVKCRTAKEAIDATKNGSVGVYPVQWFQDLKGNIYNEFQVSDKCVHAINKTHALKLANEGSFPIIRIPAQPVDYVTEYKFTRYKVINGIEREVTCTSHFSYSEAQVADFFKKDTYTKYARILIGHRAFTYGARDIASDTLMGVMESGELKITMDADLDPNDYTEVEEVL